MRRGLERRNEVSFWERTSHNFADTGTMPTRARISNGGTRPVRMVYIEQTAHRWGSYESKRVRSATTCAGT